MNAITPMPSPASQAAPDTPIPHDTTDQDWRHPAYPPASWTGWTPERQKLFLQAVAEGRSVVHACRIVGLTKQSAYAFRRRPQGAAFALAWQAACLLARDALADDMLDRALNGEIETITYRDGTSVSRHRYDNRLATTILNRLDRLADRASGEVTYAAARLVATEFDQFLECIGQGPARAGVFLGARTEEAAEVDLAPIRALARADRWLRTHAGLAEEVDTSDLDPACRHEWSAGQWARAEAAGLLALAPPRPEETTPPESQMSQPANKEEEATPALWWDDRAREWRTRYPAPPGFEGREEGEYGEEDYERALTLVEEEAIEAPYRARIAEQARIEAAERDALFGFVPVPPDPGRRSEMQPSEGMDFNALLEMAAGDADDDPEDEFEDEDEDENWDYSRDAEYMAQLDGDGP